MKLVIEFDPWGDCGQASAAAAAFKLLGLSVHLREMRRMAPLPQIETVVFEAPEDAEGRANSK